MIIHRRLTRYHSFLREKIAASRVVAGRKAAALYLTTGGSPWSGRLSPAASENAARSRFAPLAYSPLEGDRYGLLTWGNTPGGVPNEHGKRTGPFGFGGRKPICRLLGAAAGEPVFRPAIGQPRSSGFRATTQARRYARGPGRIFSWRRKICRPICHSTLPIPSRHGKRTRRNYKRPDPQVCAKARQPFYEEIHQKFTPKLNRRPRKRPAW